MAPDTADSLVFYLRLSIGSKEHLGAIRHWKNLKAAREDDYLWVKDFTADQIKAVEVRSMPEKQLYDARGGKLYFNNSYLPERNIPALLWSPIERMMPIKLPAFNHNYFGLPDKIPVRIIKSDQEKIAAAMLIPLSQLEGYINTAPAVRLSNLKWIIVNKKDALLVGNPLLPLQGEVYWTDGDFMVPAGYGFDLHALSSSLNALLNPKKLFWVVFNQDSSYFTVPRAQLRPLTIGSFRVSLKQLTEAE
jgi:hypothetical protein